MSQPHGEHDEISKVIIQLLCFGTCSVSSTVLMILRTGKVRKQAQLVSLVPFEPACILVEETFNSFHAHEQNPTYTTLDDPFLIDIMYRRVYLFMTL